MQTNQRLWVLEVVRQRIRVKHYSHRTEKAYVQ